ncbi:unnamed protein product [Caenorhabditis auriculariae]|uniref:Uncharacterized protein n=1 Tax=Caenorhabditis auriculariae TaxID=2777116 RepID=A0A8S1HLF5_9PELO|nr:unnamed protein product [Caenorhabditis auriculariae]
MRAETTTQPHQQQLHLVLPEQNVDYLPLQVIDDGEVVVLDEHHKCDDVFSAVQNRHLSCLAKFSNNDLLTKDTFGQTSLHHAAKVGDQRTIKCLIDRVPDLKDIQSSNGETPAHISAAHGDMRAVELLLGGSLRNAMKTAMLTDVNGTSVLMASVARGDNELALWLLKRVQKGRGLSVLSTNQALSPFLSCQDPFFDGSSKS